MLEITLFGKFSFRTPNEVFEQTQRARYIELLCYLLVYYDRSHAREKLASLFWENTSTAKSKKNLRQTLWQVQTILPASSGQKNTDLLLIEPGWIQFNDQADVCLDLREFEQTYTHIQGANGRSLSSTQVEAIKKALTLYRGNLLEGWYQEWCVYERERLMNMYLHMLDKMLVYCEQHVQIDQGIAYGTQILKYDRANESAHAHLMRLYALSGNRTAAIHQYQYCVAALRDELNVPPSKSTMDLYQQIINGQSGSELEAPRPLAISREVKTQPLREVLGRMYQYQTLLQNLNQQVQEDILGIELRLNSR